MSRFVLGGLDGLLNLCCIMRSIEEFKYAYPRNTTNYEDIVIDNPLNVKKVQIGGSWYYRIENSINENVTIGMKSIMALLKIENHLVAATKAMCMMASDVENKFMNVIKKCDIDYSATISEIEKSGDLILLEILINFDDLFTMCTDAIARNTTSTSVSKPPPTKEKKQRKRKSTSACFI